MANTNPIQDPNAAFTGRSTGAAVVGSRLVKVAAAKTDGNPLPIAHCGATDMPVGVAGADAAQNADVVVYPGNQILRVESAGTIAAGAGVEVTAAGKVITLATGKQVGVAWEAATNGTFPLIQLQL